jgi:hypothetical protein
MGVVAGAMALDAMAAKHVTKRRSGEEHDRGGRPSPGSRAERAGTRPGARAGAATGYQGRES